MAGTQVGQPDSTRKIETFDKVQVIAEHDGKGQALGEAVIAGVSHCNENPSILFCSLRSCTFQSDGVMDIAATRAVQNSESFKSVPYRYPIFGLQNLTATLGEFIFPWYYGWDTQGRQSDSYAHSPCHIESSVEITWDKVDQAGQAHGVAELNPVDEEADAVSKKTLSLNAYTEDEIIDFTGRVDDVNHPLKDIMQQYRDLHFRSSWSCGCPYGSDMMYVSLPAYGNLANTMDSSQVDHTSLVPSLRDGYVLETMGAQRPVLLWFVDVCRAHES